MRFLSVCSGIEAASAAWGPLGWKAVAFSEIEPFPCAVLAHHYPDTPNWGDMTKFEEWPDVSTDLLCGGTPCQSFSVAGLRKGLDDPRGNLMLTFGAIAAKYRPKWLVWENVPGVLSSNGGADFGSFLGMLGQLGYGFAYRVLDAQYFGVAQRRRRVFVVGCLGDWRSAAAVLFERHSLQGHPAPSRQAGQAVTPTIRAGAANGGPGHGARSGGSKDELILPVAKSLRGQPNASNREDSDTYIAVVSPTLRAGGNKMGGDRPPVTDVDTCETLIPVRTLCVATGQAGAEIGADMAPTLNCNHEAPYAVYQTAHTLRGEGDGAVFEEGDRTAPLTTGTDPCANILAFDTTQVTSVANRSSPKAVDPCHPLAAGAHAPAIAFDSRMRGAEPAVGREERPPQTMVERTGAIDATKPWNVATSMQVRRLTPRECERLQSFPDDYTLIPNVKIKTVRPEKFDQDFLKYLMRGGSKTQEECMRSFADGPRYKALGNSWCVNNVRWIGERIDAVALINTTQPATNSVAELETT